MAPRGPPRWCTLRRPRPCLPQTRDGEGVFWGVLAHIAEHTDALHPQCIYTRSASTPTVPRTRASRATCSCRGGGGTGGSGGRWLARVPRATCCLTHTYFELLCPPCSSAPLLPPPHSSPSCCSHTHLNTNSLRMSRDEARGRCLSLHFSFAQLPSPWSAACCPR